MQLSPCSVLDDLLRDFREFWSISSSPSLSTAVFVMVYVLLSVIFGTYLRLDLLLGSARGCFGSTCISLCGWKGVAPLSPLLHLGCHALLGIVASSLSPFRQPHFTLSIKSAPGGTNT